MEKKTALNEKSVIEKVFQVNQRAEELVQPDQIIKEILQRIIDNNPYGFILRPELKEKTGGLLHGRSMANMDCLGRGIQNRFLVGNTTAYPVESVVQFLKDKISVPA